MKIEIHVVHHPDEWTRGILQRMNETLSEQSAKIWAMKILQEKQMHTLDEVLAKVTEEDTKVDGILSLVAGLKQQLADALSGVTLPSAVQEKIDAVFDKASASADKIDSALNANVPPTP